jgi:hypothetical protein
LKHIFETVKTLSLILFQALFTTFSGYFSAFPHGTFALSVYLSIFSLGRNLSPIFGLYYQTILLMDSIFFTNFGSVNGAVTLFGHIISYNPVFQRIVNLLNQLEKRSISFLPQNEDRVGLNLLSIASQGSAPRDVKCPSSPTEVKHAAHASPCMFSRLERDVSSFFVVTFSDFCHERLVYETLHSVDFVLKCLVIMDILCASEESNAPNCVVGDSMIVCFLFLYHANSGRLTASK